MDMLSGRVWRVAGQLRIVHTVSHAMCTHVSERHHARPTSMFLPCNLHRCLALAFCLYALDQQLGGFLHPCDRFDHMLSTLFSSPCFWYLQVVQQPFMPGTADGSLRRLRQLAALRSLTSQQGKTAGDAVHSGAEGWLCAWIGAVLDWLQLYRVCRIPLFFAIAAALLLLRTHIPKCSIGKSKHTCLLKAMERVCLRV